MLRKQIVVVWGESLFLAAIGLALSNQSGLHVIQTCGRDETADWSEADVIVTEVRRLLDLAAGNPGHCQGRGRAPGTGPVMILFDAVAQQWIVNGLACPERRAALDPLITMICGSAPATLEPQEAP